MTHIKIVGDVHGKIGRYKRLVKSASYSIQLGDMGFDYKGLDELDSDRHVFFGGNHDNYDLYDSCPHSLGGYGAISLGGLEFFFIRGSFSIDCKRRQIRDSLYGTTTYGKSWWKEEELSYREMEDALVTYKKHLPDCIITHDCPEFMAKEIGSPEALRSFGFDPETYSCNTQQMLTEVYEIWQPNLWIFGHFHKDIVIKRGHTTFICLNELSSLDIDKEGNWKFKGEKGNVDLY